MCPAKSSREFAASTPLAPFDVLFAISLTSKDFKGPGVYLKSHISANWLKYFAGLVRAISHSMFIKNIGLSH